MVETAQRLVPGAPPSQAKVAAKKKKKDKSSATNGERSHSQEAISRAANNAALMEKAPSLDKVNDSVKIRAKDLAEEAERNGAIAAAQIIIEKEGGSAEKEHKSALQIILTKRIKVLSKKLQRAVTYEALDEDKINADMRRIIESKPALEAGVAELTEASKALEIAEREADKQAKLQTKLAVEASRQSIVAENEHKQAMLYQFLHLYTLTQPSAIPSFAPPPMPAALAQATAQEVAAIGKLYADLSSSAEVVSQDLKSTLVGKLASGSKDSILEGVSYHRIMEIVEGLNNQVVEQPGAESDDVAEEEHISSEPAASAAAPPAGGILFMQESEIDDNPIEAADEVKQAEPEGGAIDGIPSSAIKGGATERGQAGAKGIILGEETAPSDVKEDGTAQAEVAEPITTTQVSGSQATKTAAQVLNGSGPKSIDWANDDDDWGDMPMQPTPVSKPTPLPPAASEAPKINGMANGTAKTVQQQPPPKQQQNSKGANNHQRGNEQRSQASQNGAPPAAAVAPVAPAAKGAPEVDEDGFVLASSKRTKMQQQQQQQQANRNAHRGERGGYRGHGGRGGGFAQRGSSFGDNRGRGRGRGGRQGHEQSSEA